MFYSKQLRLPRNRNPLRGMWGRRSSQETAGNLTVVQRQEGIWLHPWGLELRIGQRQRHIHQHPTPWPSSWSTINSASCFARLLYCICINILCGSYGVQGDNQGLAALPLSSLLPRLWRYASCHSPSQWVLLHWLANDTASSDKWPLIWLSVGGRVATRLQGKKSFWWQIAHLLGH